MDKVNILLVDDQPGKLLAYQAILGDLGANLISATSGHEALRHLLKEEYALILLDVVMPDMDGFETAALIRQRPRLERTPIIFVTAYTTSELDRIRGYELGAVDFVFAPIVPEILRAKVAALAELYRNRLELANINAQLRAEIVERSRAEEQHRESEERFRLMVENVKDYGIFMLDPEGHVVTWNAGAARLMGYRSDEIVGKHCSCFYSPADVRLNIPEAGLRNADAEGRYETEDWRTRKNGSQFWAHVVITAVRDPQGNLVGFANLTRDLTERKRVQEKLLQTERLAAIGEMVAGLTHESRNALQQIQASVEMLARRITSRDEASLIVEIQRSHDRIHHLLEAVRGYAAPINLKCEVLDLAQIWREVWAQLTPQRLGRAVDFIEDVDGLDLRCSVDQFSIERVFRNILENALAACKESARITVACSGTELNGAAAIRVRITDNGVGMTEEQRLRIFEPFYTTKTTGTGLGMAIAMRVVQAHGGQIVVADGPPPGTTIEVLLPTGQI